MSSLLATILETAYKDFKHLNFDPLFLTLEKAMTIHSSTLAWKIPWTEEPGRLQSMGSQRVHWATSLSLFTFLHWRRKWQPTPVFLPGESQGRGSLVSCRLWGRTESDWSDAAAAAAAAASYCLYQCCHVFTLSLFLTHKRVLLFYSDNSCLDLPILMDYHIFLYYHFPLRISFLVP